MISIKSEDKTEQVNEKVSDLNFKKKKTANTTSKEDITEFFNYNSLLSFTCLLDQIEMQLSTLLYKVI